MKKTHDKHVCAPQEYEPGDMVYLEVTNLTSDRPTKKLDNKCFGPFKVEHKVDAAAYKLQLPPTWPAIHPVFHNSYLTPYRTPRFSQQQRPPLPPGIIVKDATEFEVEEILNSQRCRGKLQYLV